jgi:hypothetical protein
MFAFIIAGCGGLPGWISEPPQIPHSLTAVGVYAETYDPTEMYKGAEFDARKRIGRVLDYKVQEVLKDWARSRKEAFSDQAISESYFESISRGLMSMNLPNVEIRKFHFDEEERRMYALAVLDFDRVRPDVQKLVKKQTQEHIPLRTKEDVDAAFRELDEALKKAAIK